MGKKTFSEGILSVFNLQSSMLLSTFFEERAGLGRALFLKNTKWLQLFAQEILALASSGTEVNKTQSTD